MISLYFYVPNFQEDNPKLLVKNLRTIKTSNTEGQLVMSRIGKLKLSKSKVSQKGTIKFFNSNFEFYIETITKEFDITNRPAIVGVYGKIPVFNDLYTIEDWLFDVCNKVENFSKSINRPLQNLQIDTMRNELFEMWLREKWKKNILPLVKFICVLIAPIIIAVLMKSIFDIPNILMSGYLVAISNGIFFILIILKRRNF